MRNVCCLSHSVYGILIEFLQGFNKLISLEQPLTHRKYLLLLLLWWWYCHCGSPVRICITKGKSETVKEQGKCLIFPQRKVGIFTFKPLKADIWARVVRQPSARPCPPPPRSATLRYGENPTRHTQRVLRSFDGCLSHLLFYVPQTSRVKRSSAWHCTCVLLRRDGGCRAACVAKVGKGIGRCSETCGQYHPEPAGFSCECKTH